jgi:hypothetical protein
LHKPGQTRHAHVQLVSDKYAANSTAKTTIAIVREDTGELILMYNLFNGPMLLPNSPQNARQPPADIPHHAGSVVSDSIRRQFDTGQMRKLRAKKVQGHAIGGQQHFDAHLL